MKFIIIYAKGITLSFLFIILFAQCINNPNSGDDQNKLNILFIAIDDLNDWTGYLGGHPNARTPNIDRLAKSGVYFSKAYCSAPACGPSRASLMTGILPSSSGIYLNSQYFRQSRVLENAVTIPQYFMQNGYTAIGSGKIFHEADSVSWNDYWPSFTKTKPNDPMPPANLLPLNGIPDTRSFDWGPVDAPNEQMGDWKVANWVIGQLQKQHDKPFFLACGFYRPHLPWYVPDEYFDFYPEEKITLPAINENDLNDVPAPGKRMARTWDNENVLKYGQHKNAVKGYLASISFVDACVGRVIQALENSAYKNNTIIVLWSDHGWHLGEKLHWRKFALWEEATHNNLIIIAPGLTEANTICEKPVSLIDIYPTLVELCNLPPKNDLNGKSLVPIIKDPDIEWQRPALTTHGFMDHALRTDRWRYIRYADGSEELYDHNNDEQEWDNLAGKDDYKNIIDELKYWLPKENEPCSPYKRESSPGENEPPCFPQFKISRH
jgi:arylsulfatase A-like enzyme